MKVLADTNILISAFVFPGGTPDRALKLAGDKHTLILCRYIISEMEDVVKRKWPDVLEKFDKFFEDLPFTLVEDQTGNGTMSDPKDLPILNTAIAADVDVIISGDRHFHELDIEKPKILTAKEFCERA